LSNHTSGMGLLHDLPKITKVDEIILKNNFYVRLEIVARGRYIYETFECKVPNFVGLQSSNGNLAGGASQIDNLRFTNN